MSPYAIWRVAPCGTRVLDLASSLERHKQDVPTIPIDLLSIESVKAAADELKRMWDTVDGSVNPAGYNSQLFR